MNMLISFALPHHFGLLLMSMSKNQANTTLLVATYLAHGICILSINILEHIVYLAFEFQLASFRKFQPGSINDGQKDSIKPGFAYFHTCRFDSL